MRDDVTIISPGCRFNRELTMRCKFPFNSIFGICGKNWYFFYLITDVIWKNVNKPTSLPIFNKVTKFS